MTDLLFNLSQYFRFNLHGLLNILCGLSMFTLGVLVFLKDPKSKVHQSFLLITVTALMWTMGFGMFSLVRDEHEAQRWLAVAYFLGVPFISPSVYQFSYFWLGAKKGNLLVMIAFSLAVPLMIPWVFSNETVALVGNYRWGRFPRFNNHPFSLVWVSLLLLHLIGLGGIAFANFFRGWRNSTLPSHKKQYRNFLIVFFIAYCMGIGDFVNYFFQTHYPVGYLALTVLVSGISYTIVRHRFLDIRLVIKRMTFIILIYAVLFGLLIFLGLPILKGILNQAHKDPIKQVFLFSLAVGLLLSLGPIIYAYLIKSHFWLRTNLTQGLTHELKSPLNAINSSLEILEEQIQHPHTNKTTSLQYVEIIKNNTKRLRVFIDDLLNLSKIQDQSISIDKSPTNLDELLTNVIDLYASMIKQKGLHLEVVNQFQKIIELDKEKIQQVFSNLLSNAIKFSTQGTIRIELKEEGKNLLCSVSDEGRGIPEKDLERIFDRFYQGPNPGRGAGIGLSIAKAWVEAHGGKIWAQPTNNKGTKLIFFIPI